MTRVKNAVEGRKETRRRLEKMDEREGEKKNGRMEEERRNDMMRIKSEGRDEGMRS